MRNVAVVSLLVAVGLAGCTQGTPEFGDDFTPTCPSWIKGLSTAVYSGPGWFHPNGTNFDSHDRIGGGGLLSFQGKPVDQVELDFHLKIQKDAQGNPVRDDNGTVKSHQQFLYVERGTLQVQFFRNDTGETLLAYDSSKGPAGPNNPPRETLTWAPGMYTNFTIHIDLAHRNDDARPTAVEVHWFLLGDRSGNGDTAAWALRDTTAYFWYRSCNADGSAATV